MAGHKNSNKNQSAGETAYQFGEFRLYPAERMLKQGDAAVPLTAKALDTLLCLISNAGRLVTKEELMQTVWPGTFVAEANLTNAIVSLRKIVGRDAIRTVSKYGYRFELPVDGEPGVTVSTYEFFSKAKELTAHRSPDSVRRARDLYWMCLAEDPSFAPAWAWLGRTSALLGKITEERSGETELALAHSAIQRALAIDPDLACAHQFYTSIQTDTGQAVQALERLGQRLMRHPAEPEMYAGLVQALRYSGLVDESLGAHRKAVELDPAILTSVPHTYFLQGDFHAALESYSGRGGFYLDAAAWAALGDREHSRSLLSKRLGNSGGSDVMRKAMESLLAIVEGRFEEAVAPIRNARGFVEPEMLFYFARHFSGIGRSDDAVEMIERATDAGFVCSAQTLRNDPWLESVRSHPQFAALLRNAEDLVDAARVKWRPWSATVKSSPSTLTRV